MAERSTNARPSIEAYAAQNASSVLVAAYLLNGDWPAAEDAAARALVAGRRVAVDAADGELAIRALARRHAGRRWTWRSGGGGLELRELSLQTTSAVEDESGLPWSSLAQLTEHERAAIVLRSALGLSKAEIGAVLGRPAAAIDRDLATAAELVGQSDSERLASLKQIEAVLADFQPERATSALPTGRVAKRAAEIDRRRVRTTRAVASVAATAVVLAAAGVVVYRSGDSPEASPAASPGDVAINAGDAVISTSPATLPTVGRHHKLVGFRSVVVAVPSSWRQVSSGCRAVTRNAIVYPTNGHAPLCGDSDLRRGLSVVSFNHDIAGEPEVEGDFGPRRTHTGEFVVSAPSHRGGRYVAYTSAPDLGFGMSITTRSRHTLNQIIDSITVIPTGYTTVPDCVGLRSDRVMALLYAHGLVAEQLYDHSAVGLPLEVIDQSRSVGTVVPVQTHITLGMLPT